MPKPKLTRDDLLMRDKAIHCALSFLQTIVDDEPFTIGEADRVMEVLRCAICPACRHGQPHTRATPHL